MERRGTEQGEGMPAPDRVYADYTQAAVANQQITTQ